MANTTTNRPLYQIAMEISNDWGEKISVYAKPYIEAMFSLKSIKDDFLMDTGLSVVSYFLSNAGTWKGETARRVKKELKGMLK